MQENLRNSLQNHNEYIELPILDGDTFPSESVNGKGGADFDPYNHGKKNNAISFWPAVIHTFIAAASPTLMNMPSTFNQVGYVIGFISSFLVVLFYANCMHTLVAVEYTLCKKLRKPNLTYAEVIYNAFTSGPRRLRRFAYSAKLLVYVDFLCIWGGGNTINALLASENVKNIYDYFFDADISIRRVMIYLSFPLVALCWIPNLKLLAVCSAVANVANISCIVIIIYVIFNDFPSTIIANREAIGGSVFRIPLFLGVILITVNSTGIIMPLKNEMKKPSSLSSRCGVLNAAYFSVAFLYPFFGAVCCLKYGENVKENVVFNMPDNNFGKIVVGLYAASIIFTYPLMSYVAFDTVWNNILEGKVRKNSAYSMKKFCCRTLIAVLSIAVAFIVPDIALFVSLTGNVGVSLDSIIFPALAELLLIRGRAEATTQKCVNTARVFKNITYIILGVILCVSGILDSLAALFRHYRYRTSSQ